MEPQPETAAAHAADEPSAERPAAAAPAVAQPPLLDCRADPELLASFSAGSAAAAAQRRAAAKAVAAGSQPCDHPFVQHFGGKFSCADCWAEFETVAPNRIAGEMRKLVAAQAEDAAISANLAEHSSGLAVRVDWLIAFTTVHDCWDWTTREVQAYIIKPATEATRCRYADLEHVRAAAGVGSTDVMVSRASALGFRTPTRPCMCMFVCEFVCACMYVCVRACACVC